MGIVVAVGPNVVREEIAFRMRLITAAQLEALAVPLLQSEYGQYLVNLMTSEREYFSQQ